MCLVDLGKQKDFTSHLSRSIKRAPVPGSRTPGGLKRRARSPTVGSGGSRPFLSALTSTVSCPSTSSPPKTAGMVFFLPPNPTEEQEKEEGTCLADEFDSLRGVPRSEARNSHFLREEFCVLCADNVLPLYEIVYRCTSDLSRNEQSGAPYSRRTLHSLDTSRSHSLYMVHDACVLPHDATSNSSSR